MSTAWYRSNAIPKLIKQWKPKRDKTTPAQFLLDGLEVWDTTCVVTNFGKTLPKNDDKETDNRNNIPAYSVLINPANPNLRGVRDFPYFPKGGPEPKQPPAKDAHHIMGYVTQWGGMDVGQGMLFSANVVDGLVHQLDSDQELARSLEKIKHCPEGQAVFTSVSEQSELFQKYSYVVHTVPPFYDQTDNSLLGECYKNALRCI